MHAESAPPPGGFTFADKRKVNSDGTPRTTGGAEGANSAPSAPDRDRIFGDVGRAAAGPDAPVNADNSAGVDSAGVESAVVDEVTDPTAALAAERLADLQRLQAEYANYRKRVDRDRGVAREAAISSVVESLLPVLDDIHLARQHGDLESGPFVSIAEKLEATVGKYGVERYGAPGEPFDPAVHEALMRVEAELAEGTEVSTVVSVLQPGYRLGEKVIRPARVSVADPG